MLKVQLFVSTHDSTVKILLFAIGAIIKNILIRFETLTSFPFDLLQYFI